MIVGLVDDTITFTFAVLSALYGAYKIRGKKTISFYNIMFFASICYALEETSYFVYRITNGAISNDVFDVGYIAISFSYFLIAPANLSEDDIYTRLTQKKDRFKNHFISLINVIFLIAIWILYIVLCKDMSMQSLYKTIILVCPMPISIYFATFNIRTHKKETIQDRRIINICKFSIAFCYFNTLYMLFLSLGLKNYVIIPDLGVAISNIFIVLNCVRGANDTQ